MVIGVGGDDLPASAQRRETKAMIKPRRSHLNREGEYWKSVLTALTSAEMILLLVAATIRQAGKRNMLLKTFKYKISRYDVSWIMDKNGETS